MSVQAYTGGHNTRHIFLYRLRFGFMSGQSFQSAIFQYLLSITVANNF